MFRADYNYIFLGNTIVKEKKKKILTICKLKIFDSTIHNITNKHFYIDSQIHIGFGNHRHEPNENYNTAASRL